MSIPVCQQERKITSLLKWRGDEELWWVGGTPSTSPGNKSRGPLWEQPRSRQARGPHAVSFSHRGPGSHAHMGAGNETLGHIREGVRMRHPSPPPLAVGILQGLHTPSGKAEIRKEPNRWLNQRTRNHVCLCVGSEGKILPWEIKTHRLCVP